TDKYDDYTIFDTDIPVCDDLDFLNEVEESDLENNISDFCDEFHYQILLYIQFQLNDTTITQNDYVLAYKVTKETETETQIINENDF
ncbi:375_t:CDS:2, partial [Cetraspora pellucida]